MGDWDDDERDDELDGWAGDPEAPDEVRAELEAVAAAEGEMHDAMEAALTEAQQALESQRAATRAALVRYRGALLAAEPDLPPDLVCGSSTFKRFGTCRIHLAL
ncbi:MAG: hypothetical protein EXR68_03725 [Dehalococcoidia bacterium]|nr:hypothetical protein [Dehalococcoidia bacterium]